MASVLSLPIERPRARLRLFSGADTALLESATAGCECRDVGRGERLLARGEPNETTYLLLSGRLGVYLEPDHPAIAEVLPGDCAGEMSVLSGTTASADVVAEEESRVLEIPADVLWGLVDQSHAVARNLLHLLADRIRHGDDLIRWHLRSREAFEREAQVDTLTGLPNRRWMEQAFGAGIERSLAAGRPMTLLLLDADRFKTINDRHGHLAGDRVLRALGQIVAGALEPGQLAARFGGEEFALALPDTRLPDGVKAAERLRQAVAAARVVADDGRPLGQVTVSIGACGLRTGDTLESLLAGADAALYRAKRRGRNRVST